MYSLKTTELIKSTMPLEMGLQQSYSSLLQHGNELDQIETLSDKQFIESVDLINIIEEMAAILSACDGMKLEIVINKFETVLANRWSFVENIPCFTYPYSPSSPMTQFCLSLAGIALSEFPEKYLSIYQLLMPSLLSVYDKVLGENLDDLALHTFMLNKDNTYPIPLSILLSYCIDLIKSGSEKAFNNYNPNKTELSKSELEALANLTMEGAELYKAAKRYPRSFVKV